MKNIKRICLIVVAFAMIVSVFASCGNSSDEHSGKTDFEYYIKINNETVSREYIGYFFYLARRNMLEEAGWKFGEDSNATEEDIKRYWETTDIDGKDAVFAARNLAADNVVRQKIQYYKAVEEGIELSASEKEDIASQLESTINNNGGEEKFREVLAGMDTNMDAYRQIITENAYILKLYDMYDSEERFTMSAEEFDAFAIRNADVYPPEQMHEAAKKQVFNDMVTQWEKEFDIEINDSAMNDFTV